MASRRPEKATSITNRGVWCNDSRWTAATVRSFC
jgi:hypothetical protein